MPRTPWLAGLLWLCLSPPAHAHSPIPGIEGFYVGLLHPFSTPAQALLMLGLGLLVSGLRQRHYPLCLGIFPLAMLASLLGGSRLPEPDAALFAAAAAVCAMAAIWPRPLLPAALAAIAAGALLIGQASIPDPGPERDRFITMAGSFVGAVAGLLYVAGGVVFLKDRFARSGLDLALRVLAAWLGAIALVMLALQSAAPGAAM